MRCRFAELVGLAVILAAGLGAGCGSGTQLEGDFVQHDTGADDDVGDCSTADGQDCAGEDGSAGDGDSDASGTCPQPGTNWIEWQMDGEYELVADIDLSCVLADEHGEGSDHLDFTFECGPGSTPEVHRLDVFSEALPYLGLAIGQAVRLQYVGSRTTRMNRWLRVVDASRTLMVGALDADALAPPGADAMVWYSPFLVTAIGGICAPKPMECGLWEDEALRVCLGTDCLQVLAWEPEVLRGARVAFIFPMGVGMFHDITCPDASPFGVNAVLLVFAIS